MDGKDSSGSLVGVVVVLAILAIFLYQQPFTVFSPLAKIQPESGNDQWAWPFQRPSNPVVSQAFGKSSFKNACQWYTNCIHPGVDFTNVSGQPIYPAWKGRSLVVFAGGNAGKTGYGYHVILDHGNGIETLYGHMKAPPLVRAGQTVNGNTTLGYVGSTGKSTAPHLHLGMRQGGNWFDPMTLLR